MPILRIAAIFALATAVAMPAAAQERVIYRSIDKNGRITFSDTPPQNVRFVEAINVPTGPMSTGDGSTPRQLTQEQQQLLDAANARSRGLAQASQEISTAYADLQAAKAAQAAGVEPLEGERIGTYGGFSRFRESYWDRQRQLESAVADAQHRLEAAIAKRNDLR